MLTAALVLVLAFLFAEAPCDGLGTVRRDRFCAECLAAKTVVLIVTLVTDLLMLDAGARTATAIQIVLSH